MVSGHWIDSASGAVILNESGLPGSDVVAAFSEQYPEYASLVRWSNQAQARPGGLFERDRYVTPDNIYDQMRTSYHAANNDDAVAGVLEMSEALALGRVDFEGEDIDEENIWQQIASDIDLTSRLREMWRESFIVSQFYGITFWALKEYKVTGRSRAGTKRKKSFGSLRVPVGISLLDPLKVIPIGNMLFNQERLAYIASRTEAESFDKVLAGQNTSDLVVKQMIEAPYVPDEAERLYLGNLGINPDYLFLLNDKFVWRFTETRPSYERFANVRMKSIFELLDLKHQLRAMDRAHLLGATNFIIIFKKGSDELPAKPAEVSALAAQVRAQSRTPVIVGDHRLEVEIVTPKTDNTLSPDRYNGLDARITARLFGMFLSGNFAAGAKNDDSIKLAKVLSRGLETRRASIVRSVQKNVVDRTIELNPQLTGWAEIRFHPKHIALDFDAAAVALIQDLRNRGDISRESVLDELGFDQDDEARKREREKMYDKIFVPVNVPFDSPQKTGGVNPDSRTSNQSPIHPRQGNND